jgi:cell shape-determining protein MreD
MPPYSRQTLLANGVHWLAALLVGFLVIVLSTTVFNWWAIGGVRIQPVTAVVVWCGFKLPLLTGGLLVMLLGGVSDSLSGGVIGLQIFINVFIFCGCVIAESKLALDNWIYQMAATGAMSITNSLLATGGLLLISHNHLLPSHFWLTLLLQAAASALCAPLFFIALESLSKLFQKLLSLPERDQIDGG